MKMKKLISGITVLAMSTLVLAACGGNSDKETKESSTASSEVAKDDKKDDAPTEKIAGGDLKDGEYTLEEKNENNGYRATFTMIVKNGKITESKYDNVDKDGKSKIEDKDYNKNMKDKSGTSPETFIPELNEALVSAQSADAVDVVTGATHSTESFKNYAQQLIQAAQAGNTDKIEIDNGADLKDGEYTLEEKNDSNGYHTVFTMLVKGGKITESKYDNVNADGKSKTEDKDYNDMMGKDAGTSPDKFIPELNKGLVDKQVPSDMDVVTGATHSTHSFQMYAEQLINAAEKGNTDKIEVDNIVFGK
ncbi:MAG: extracellular electron transfer flavoprotein PplA [Vagococcus sp.]